MLNIGIKLSALFLFYKVLIVHVLINYFLFSCSRFYERTFQPVLLTSLYEYYPVISRSFRSFLGWWFLCHPSERKKEEKWAPFECMYVYMSDSQTLKKIYTQTCYTLSSSFSCSVPTETLEGFSLKLLCLKRSKQVINLIF